MIHEKLLVEERIRREWWKQYREIQESSLANRNICGAWEEWRWMHRTNPWREYILDEYRKTLRKNDTKSHEVRQWINDQQ